MEEHRRTSPLDARRAIADKRARDIAAAWRRGDRNIRSLATRHGISRETVYADLRAQGIDPTDRTAPVEEPDMTATAQLDRAEQAFTRSTEGFTMDVRLDAGADRRLHFESGLDWWDLHTFPGGLMVRGGHGTFVFANGADVFESLRFTGADPAYWAEKMSAGVARSWSEDRFRAWLAEEADTLGVLDQARELILDSDDEYDLAYEDAARWALATTYDELSIDFPAPDEADLRDWDFHYLWTLHAVRAGIRAWDQAQADKS